MTPESLKKNIVVPFSSLSANEFENLCCDILNRENPKWTFELYGRSGQKQFGVDIVGINIEGRLIGIECKCWKEINLNIFKKQ